MYAHPDLKLHGQIAYIASYVYLSICTVLSRELQSLSGGESNYTHNPPCVTFTVHFSVSNTSSRSSLVRLPKVMVWYMSLNC